MFETDADKSSFVFAVTFICVLSFFAAYKLTQLTFSKKWKAQQDARVEDEEEERARRNILSAMLRSGIAFGALFTAFIGLSTFFNILSILINGFPE